MIAGRLRHRVTLQRYTESQDTYGESIKTWANVATVYARVQPLQGKEYEQAQQMQAETTHKIELRHDNDVTPKDRLQFGTRLFHILQVLNINEQNKQDVLLVKEDI